MENRRHQEGKAPEVIKAEDILAKLRAGVREVHEIEIRGTVIPVRVLSADEMNRIRQEAVKDTTIARGDETDKNLHIQKTTLVMATTVPVGSAPMLSAKILGMLTVDEIAYLFDQYIGVMQRVNPSVETIDAQEFRALVDALKKKSISVKDLSLRQLRGICSHSVDGTPIQEQVI